MEIQKGELSKTPFNIIQNSDILTKEDLDILTPLTKELQESFKKSQVFRTRTEMEVSVLNNLKFPTPAAKYWQSVKEQNVMFSELVMLSYEYRKNIVEIKKLQRDLEAEEDVLESELIQIEIEKKLFVLKNQEKTAKDRIREIKAWSEIKERESALMKVDDLGNVDNHQLISYTKRWINQVQNLDASTPVAERNNLLGQLQSGISKCIELGIIDRVLKGQSEFIVNKIKQDYKLK